MTKSIAAKMGIRPGGRALFIDAPAETISGLELPLLDVSTTPDGLFDYIFLFITSQQQMHAQFAALKEHLNIGGMLWVSWPKGRQLGTDLTLPKVIEIGYTYGLVESKSLSLDPVWSALKFTHPIPGKTYANSFGKLNL
ncbi:hypothetical protein [Spirosoma sp. 209]|uniref:hypothetical protein n=1 Tax=Spirosoma sp. 209 TaxID=1955701 RepID=UPI00098D4DB2|nr:hypothetical protein [Spirosoma sp. 209]